MSGSIELSRFCTLGTGGKGRVTVLEDAKGLNALDEPCLIFGRGSNLLISDEGVSERVIVNRLGGIEFNGNTVYAESGVSLPYLCRECERRGLSGLEWASGIPGSVGGAVKMNAGAYGGNISAVARSITVYRDGKLFTLTPDECGFSYRNSNIHGFIVGATLTLTAKAKEEIRLKRLDFAKRRALTQPKGKSAGSVFKGADKPAGWYIERAGLKGARRGGAKISEKHANFIINEGGATSRDIYELILKAEREVYERFGVKLEREIELIGEF